MSNEIIQHTTLEGQRWDQIATIRYGRPELMNLLIKSNPDIPIMDKFPAGVFVNVPILKTTDEQIQNNRLPPWKEVS